MAITAREAIELLEQVPPETILVGASDPEGNDHHPIDTLQAGHVRFLPHGSTEIWFPAGEWVVVNGQEQFQEYPNQAPSADYQLCLVCVPGYDPTPGIKLPGGGS